MIAISSNKRWPWWFPLMAGCLASWSKYVEEYDPMRVARCDAKCSAPYTRSDQCMDNCLAGNYTKPGYCPEGNSMSPFEAACIIACANDSQCPDLAKCCANDCGITCMRPTNFDNSKDIPPIPESIEIRREKSNLVMLSWKIASSDTQDSTKNKSESSVRYLVEERHVLGPRYSESRLSSWSVRHVSSKAHAVLRAGLKTGHWYQFRVAAVNENGSHGYSAPSGPFKTAEPRNPREPRNLSLTGARVQADGKLGILLRWRPPPSDVPIAFYKLFWSRLIHGPNNDSILVYHRNIPKEKACYEVKNLEIGCQYFLQVQAVAVYGGRRLASRKASKVFNSTDYEKYGRDWSYRLSSVFQADGEGRSRRCEKHHAGLRVRRLICRCADEIEARLVWPPDPKATGYNVTWSQVSCEILTGKSQQNKNLSSRIMGSRITHRTRQDIKGLQINCTYTVNVTSIAKAENGRREREFSWLKERKIGIEFVTNECQNRHAKRTKRERGVDSSSRCRRRKSRLKT